MIDNVIVWIFCFFWVQVVQLVIFVNIVYILSVYSTERIRKRLRIFKFHELWSFFFIGGVWKEIWRLQQFGITESMRWRLFFISYWIIRIYFLFYPYDNIWRKSKTENVHVKSCCLCFLLSVFVSLQCRRWIIMCVQWKERKCYTREKLEFAQREPEILTQHSYMIHLNVYIMVIKTTLIVYTSRFFVKYTMLTSQQNIWKMSKRLLNEKKYQLKCSITVPMTIVCCWYSSLCHLQVLTTSWERIVWQACKKYLDVITACQHF